MIDLLCSSRGSGGLGKREDMTEEPVGTTNSKFLTTGPVSQ